MSREIREEHHGTRNGYIYYGCRCERCREAAYAYTRKWRAENPEKYRDEVVSRREYHRLYSEQNRDRRRSLSQDWRAQNADYYRDQMREWQAGAQASSRLSASRRGCPWEPYEDALLARVHSDVAAASALGRTFYAVRLRRQELRKEGVLS